MVDRRTFNLGLVTLLAVPVVVRAGVPDGEPVMQLAQRGSSKVYLLGYSDAYDLAWFTPRIQHAVDESVELWLETPPGSAESAATGSSRPPADADTVASVIAERGYDRSRDLFDVLPSPLAKRTLEWAARLGIERQTLAPMRPWYARFTIQQAYGATKQQKAAPGAKLVWPEAAVVDRARARHIAISSEYPTIASLIRFFADLPGDAQPEYLEEELDYLDDDAKRAVKGMTGWTRGHPEPVYLDQMRTRRPALYRAMHVERNAAWADRIERMLARQGTHFIMIGQNHVLGPDSIQANLER
ncbi:MAG: TraB/GumN family protein, partial [Sphingomonadales bacterium]